MTISSFPFQSKFSVTRESFVVSRMKAPSFFIAAETLEGITLEYRSKRRGFQFYVQGQIKEISKTFEKNGGWEKKLEISLKKQEVSYYI